MSRPTRVVKRDMTLLSCIACLFYCNITYYLYYFRGKLEVLAEFVEIGMAHEE